MKIQAGKEKVTIIPAKLTRNAPGKSANQKLRVAAYCRVSTDSEEQINSYKNQLAYYTEKIGGNPAWKMAGIYADEGITGTSMKHREDFKRMLRACREGRIDLILCKSVSRFGRNSVDVLRTIRALRERGIGVMFEKEAVDTRTMNSELILAFHSAFSQSESESISGNVRWGLRKAYENGTISIGPNLYGFRKGQDGGVEIDEEKATVIRQIARWFLDGDSLHAIADKLAQRHIPSPKGKETWSTATLRSLLTNEKYKGDALLQKTYRPSLFSDRAVQNDGDLPKYYVEGVLPFRTGSLRPGTGGTGKAGRQASNFGEGQNSLWAVQWKIRALHPGGVRQVRSALSPGHLVPQGGKANHVALRHPAGRQSKLPGFPHHRGNHTPSRRDGGHLKTIHPQG